MQKVNIFNYLKRLPVGRERLIGNYRTSLSLILILATLYSFVRGIAYLSYQGYEAYTLEFERVVGNRLGLGIYWLCTSFLLVAGLFHKGYLVWRLGFIAVGVGLGSWAALFYINRGFRVFDAIHTYAAFSTLFFILATLAYDPRPLRKIRETLENGPDFRRIQ